MTDNDRFRSTSQSRMPSTSKRSHKRKSNSNRPSRKIGITWTEKDESRLILAVQKQRPLWDCAVPGYKSVNAKLDSWKVVANELGWGDDFSEARKKWNSMRSNFKTFLAKHRAKGSNQESEEVQNVKYPHFNELLFIETADLSKVGQSTPPLKLENVTSDESIFDESSNCDSELDPIAISKTGSQRAKRSAVRTPIIELRSSSSVFEKEISTEVLTDARAKPDRFTAIGEVFAGHLRILPPSDAIDLESRLFKVMYDFLGYSTSSRASPNSYKRSR